MPCTFIPPNSPAELDEDAYKAYLLNGGLKAFSASGVVKMPELKRLLTEQMEIRAEQQRKGGKERDKSYINRVIESDKVSDLTKQKLSELGEQYKTASAEEAYNMAKDIVAALGVDEAVLLAQANRFDGDINSAIFGASLNGMYDEQNSMVSQNRNDEAYDLASKSAQVADMYDKWLREAGRAINMVKYVYKQSAMTAVLRQNRSNMQAFEDRVEKENKKTFQEMLDDLNGRSEFTDWKNQLVKDAAANRKPSKKTISRPEFRKKVDKLFEDLKIGNKGTTNSFIIPAPVWDAAMEIMKQAILLGDSAIEAVEKAVAHINEKYGDAWDAKDFRDKYTPMMASLTAEDMPDSHWKKFVDKLKPKAEAAADKKQKSDIEKINDWLSRANNEEKSLLSEDIISWLNDKGIINDAQATQALAEPDTLIEVLEGLSEENQKELTDFIGENIQSIKKARAAQATLSRLKAMTQKQIESLKEQIANRERAPKKTGTTQTDNELGALRAERDDLQAQLDDLIPRPAASRRELTMEEKIARAVDAKQKAINRIQDMIDKGELRKEKGEEVSSDELDRLNEVLKQKRQEHAEMTKAILDSMYPDQKPDWYKERILNRYRNRLKRMTDEQKDEFVRRSLIAIVTNGGLNYDEFKNIIADVMGYGPMTPAQQAVIQGYVNTINEVDKLWDNLQKDKTVEALDAYEKGLQKADEAKVALADALYTRSNWVATLSSIMSLNTLGAVSLFMNVSYNVTEQVLVRMPKSIIGTTLAYTAFAVSLAANKIFGTNLYTPNINVRATQSGYFSGGKRGIAEGIRTAKTGQQAIDYLDNKTFQSRIRPLDSFKKLSKTNPLGLVTGNASIGFGEAFDTFLQATAGWSAEAVARGLTLFDKPARFAAEGAMAERVAEEELGLKTRLEKQMFLLRPEEVAKSVFVSQGMTADAAAEKAQQLKERIVRAGEKATFVQNNKVADLVQSGFDRLGKNSKDWTGFESVIKGTALTFAKSQLLFVKTPSNVMWSVLNLANPPLALAQSVYYGYQAMAKRKKGLSSDKDIEEMKNWLNHAVLGLGYKIFLPMIMASVTGGGDDDEKEKERRARESVERPNSIDVIGSFNSVFGTSIDGKFWVDLQWFGSLGSLLTIEKVKNDKMLEAKLRGEEYNGMLAVAKGMGLSAQYALSAGAFQNSIAMLDAFKKGGKVAENWLVNTLNVYGNIVQPATLAQLSKAQLGYRYRIADDTFMERVQNSLAARSSLYRLMTDRYPQARITPWGDESKPATAGGVGGMLFNLFRIDKSDEPSFGVELFEDYERTQNPQFLPPIPAQEFTISPDKLKTPEQKEMEKEAKANQDNPNDRYNENYSIKVKFNYEEWDEFQKLVGSTRKDRVAALVTGYAGPESSPYYLMPDEVKLAELDAIYRTTLEEAKQRIFGMPEFQAAIERAKMERSISVKNEKPKE